MRQIARSSVIILTSVLAAFSAHPTLDNTVICGYQGWFTCYGDGSTVERWNHWSSGQYRSDTPKPSPGNQTFEIYPDITEYPPNRLYQTGYAALGDGRPAKLFASYPYETIDIHCRWMQESGIDGVALQRFLSTVQDQTFKTHRDSVAARLMRACEKYNRMFYIMYDGVGNNIDLLLDDWQNGMVGRLKLTASPRYAFQDGKPVVCIWGFGFTHRTDVSSEALRAITTLKNAGYYVIGGVPTNWRTGAADSKAGYEAVYSAFDMVSPWTPGRYKTEDGVDNYKTNFLMKDKAKLDSGGIAYQPVIFPGFAWSNWNGGARNDIPRRQGKFLWRQFANIHSLGIRHVYVAMFDEYDEGTAIAKAAADYFDVPTNQYFLTMSADSIYVAPDFYLRLTGAAASVLRGQATMTGSVPVPNSAGPVFWRSSFEPLLDAYPSWNNRIDTAAGGVTNISGAIECAVAGTAAKSGRQSLQMRCIASSSGRSAAVCKVIDVDIPVTGETVLGYAFNPQTPLGRFASIDLVAADGTRLSATSAVDSEGVSMTPGMMRGSVNQWSRVRCAVGKWLSGKTIDRVSVVFEHTGESGECRALFDNLSIENDTTATVNLADPRAALKQGLSGRSRLTTCPGGVKITLAEMATVTMYTISGKAAWSGTLMAGITYVKLPPGGYLARISAGTRLPEIKLVVAGR